MYCAYQLNFTEADLAVIGAVGGLGDEAVAVGVAAGEKGGIIVTLVGDAATETVVGVVDEEGAVMLGIGLHIADESTKILVRYLISLGEVVVEIACTGCQLAVGIKGLGLLKSQSLVGDVGRGWGVVLAVSVADDRHDEEGGEDDEDSYYWYHC